MRFILILTLGLSLFQRCQQSQFSCQIYDATTKQSYFGRVLLSEGSIPTVKVIAYYSQSWLSKGFSLVYQFENNRQTLQIQSPPEYVLYDYNLLRKPASQIDSLISLQNYSVSFQQFPRIGSVSWLTSDVRIREYSHSADIQFRNHLPFSQRNLLNHLLIKPKFKLNKVSETELVLKGFIEIEGTNFVVVLAIFGIVLMTSIFLLLVWLCQSLSEFPKKDTTSEKNKVEKKAEKQSSLLKMFEGISWNTWMFLNYVTLIGLYHSILLWGLIPYPLLVLITIRLLFFLPTSIINNFRKQRSENHNNSFFFWIAVIIISLFVIIFIPLYSPYLIFIGNLSLILDFFRVRSKRENSERNSQERRNFDLVISGIIIFIFQIPHLTVFLFPANPWALPNQITWLGSILMSVLSVLSPIILGVHAQCRRKNKTRLENTKQGISDGKQTKNEAANIDVRTETPRSNKHKGCVSLDGVQLERTISQDQN